MTFRISGLTIEQFRHLFDLSDVELAAHGAVRRMIVISSRRRRFPALFHE